MSYDFTRASNHIATLDPGVDLLSNYPWTLAAWVKLKTLPSAAGSSYTFFNIRRHDSDFPYSQFNVNTSNQLRAMFRSIANATGEALITSPTMAASTWYLAALVHSGRFSLRAYLGNTTVETTVDMSEWDAGTNFTRICVGANKVAAGTIANPSDVRLGELAFWPGVALSAGEISNLVSGALADTIQATALANGGWWRANTDTGTTLTDSMGNYDLAVTGATYNSDHPTVGGGGGSGVPKTNRMALLGVG